jgi:sec-independent protein translocase protein TatB
MLEVGYSEILVIAIVLIVVVGPKDLPKMLRAFGRMMTKFRTVSGDFRRQFDEALREAELDEVRKTISDVRNLDPRNQLRDALNPLRAATGSLRSDVENAIKPAAATTTTAAPAPVMAPLAKPADALVAAPAKARSQVKAGNPKPAPTKTSAVKPSAAKAAVATAKLKKSKA